jgi:hypothetical protein
MARKAPFAPRKLFPVPLQPIWEHPLYETLPSAGRGMLLNVLESFWKSGCRPLPDSANALYCLARAHRSTWSTHSASILQIVRDVGPALERYHRLRETKGTTIRFVSRNGGHATAAKARAQSLADATPATVTPVTLPRHDPTQHTPPRRPQAPQRSQARLQDR